MYYLQTKYINDMLEDPAVNQYLVPNDIHLQYLQGYEPGKTLKYDLLLEPAQKLWHIRVMSYIMYDFSQNTLFYTHLLQSLINKYYNC